MREAWSHAGVHLKLVTNYRCDTSRANENGKATIALPDKIRKLWTKSHASTTVPSGRDGGDDAVPADTTTRPTLSDEVKLAWAEVDTRFTDGAVTRRYLKDLLATEAWEGSKCAEETVRNSINVDGETLARFADEVTLYAVGTRAVSDALKELEDACLGCNTSDCDLCLEYEEANSQWWTLEDVAEHLHGSWA